MELREKLIETIIAACPASIAAPTRWEAEHYADAVLGLEPIRAALMAVELIALQPDDGQIVDLRWDMRESARLGRFFGPKALLRDSGRLPKGENAEGG